MGSQLPVLTLLVKVLDHENRMFRSGCEKLLLWNRQRTKRQEPMRPAIKTQLVPLGLADDRSGRWAASISGCRIRWCRLILMNYFARHIYRPMSLSLSSM